MGLIGIKAPERVAKNARNPAVAGFLPGALNEVSAPPCFTGGAIP